MTEKNKKYWYQVVPIDAGTDDFDAAYWASQSPEERLAAVWKMTVIAHKLKGGNEHELRLDRTYFNIQPIGN